MPDPLCKTCAHSLVVVGVIEDRDCRTGEVNSVDEVTGCVVCDLGQCSPQDPCRVCVSEMDSAADWLREGAA